MGWFDSGTRMKSLGNHGDYSVHELGDKLYLFNPRKPTDRAIISSHGGHNMLTNVNQFQTPAGTTLHFYGRDHANLNDPGLGSFFRNRTLAQPVDTVNAGGNCFNYILTKYQTAPGPDAESYDSVAKLINDEVKLLERVQRRRAQLLRAGRLQQAQIQAGQEAMHPMAAVITVRHRRFRADMNLQELLNTVKAHVPRLMIFDCLFCRGHYWSDGVNVRYQ